MTPEELIRERDAWPHRPTPATRDRHDLIGLLDAARADLAAMTARAEQAEAQVAALRKALAGSETDRAGYRDLVARQDNEALDLGGRSWDRGCDFANRHAREVHGCTCRQVTTTSAAHDAEVERRAVERIVERVEDHITHHGAIGYAEVLAILGGPDEA